MSTFPTTPRTKGKAASGTAAEAGAADIDRLQVPNSRPPRRRSPSISIVSLRAKAEADNTRKRTEVEVANSRKYAVESFAAEMLAVHDSLDLARSVSLVDNAAAVERCTKGWS